MKIKQLLFILLFISTFATKSQEWMRDVKSENPNFFEIQAAFNSYWKDKPVEKGKGFKAFKRWEWFWEQRVGKSGEFPKSTILYEETVKYKGSKSAQKSQNSTSTSANWTFSGPNASAGGYAGIGRINCIAFHPTDVNTFWVGTPAGGMWKTTDAGITWTTNTDDLPVLGVSDIAIDPTNANIMYIATGDGEGAYSLQNGAGDTKSIGILKSTDGGLTWTAALTASVSQNVLIRRLIINPSNPQNLLAATNLGIWRTIDGGTNWSSVTSTSLWFMDMEFKPGDANFVYATSYDTGGNAQIYQSTNNGVTWIQVSSFSGYSRINLAISANSPNLVDALCANTSYGLGGLWYSNNSGASFTQYYTGNCSNNLLHNSFNGSGCGGQGYYDLAYAINPSNSNDKWLGGINTWRSTDGGANWALNNIWTNSQTGSVPEVHADKHFLAFHPLNNSLVYECNDGGLYVTNNGGASWQDITNGMGISQMYRIGASATVADKVICGLQDNGSKEIIGNTWFDVTGGDGMECIIDYTNSSIQYGTYVNGEIRKTTNNWFSSSVIVQNGGSGVDANGNWVTPYIMHPTNNNILLVGKSQVYRTINGGTSWSQLGTISGISGNINAMAYAPSNPSVIYVATEYQIFKTINGGTSWTFVTNSTNRITYMCVDPTNSQRIWMTNSGYVAGDKVWHSPDGGVNWNDWSGSLPNVPVNCIVYQNGSADGLYIGTDIGVFFRDASMTDWITYNSGLPNVIVTELEISASNNKLWAGTFGRGLWSTSLYCVEPSQPISINGSTSVCDLAGTTQYSVALVSGATSYVWTLPDDWSGSSTSNVINVTPGTSGNILVASSNSCGLSSAQSVFVTVSPLPNVSAVSSSTILCANETATINASGASSYTWNPGGNATTIIVSPSVTTSYVLTGTDTNGCSANFAFTQDVSACASINGVTRASNTMFVYPNPFSNIFVLAYTNSQCNRCNLTIYNALGSVLYQQSITKQFTELDLSIQSPGIYFIKVTDENTSIIQKIIKD
jgi:hypothetical protein